MMAMPLLAAFTWDPGFKGILTVVVATTILCGGVALILGTNSGARLGFLLAITGLFGWFFVMGLIWAVYGIGYKGPAPTWNVVDVTTASPASSKIDVAGSLTLPEQLPDPIQVRDSDPKLLSEFPAEAKDPTLGDLVTVDSDLEEAVNAQVAPWKILSSSNKYSGETASVVGEALGPDDLGTFTSPSDFIVIDGFVTGGKKGRTDNSVLSRIAYKFTSAVEFNNKPFYAAVQVQPVITQVAKDGEAPPLPVANPDAPIYTVILERDRGALRLPSIVFTIFSGSVFAICANMLHRRDKLADAQRAAVAGAGA